MSRKIIERLCLFLLVLCFLSAVSYAEPQPARRLELTVFEIGHADDHSKAKKLDEARFDFNHFFYTPNDYNAYYDHHPGKPGDPIFTGEEVASRTMGYAEFQVNQSGSMLMHATEYGNKHNGATEVPGLTLQKWDDKEQKWVNLGLPKFTYESVPWIKNLEEVKDPKIGNPSWRNYGTGRFRVAVWAARNYDSRYIFESYISFYILFRPDEPWIEDQADKEEIIFGSRDIDEFSFKGDIFFLQPNTAVLPDFDIMDPVGSIYAKELNIPTRNFKEGFPGITGRYEWFGIRYSGRFHIDRSGIYNFRTYSDDGSILYIDGRKILDNDGIHPGRYASGSCNLSEGIHELRLDYFQGPAAALSLILYMTPPGGKEEVFRPKFASNKGLGGPCDNRLWGTQEKGTGPLKNAKIDGNRIFLKTGGKILSQEGDNDGYAIWKDNQAFLIVDKGKTSKGKMLPRGEYTVIPGLGNRLSFASVSLCLKENPLPDPSDCEKKLTGSQTVGTGPLDPAKTESTTLILGKNAVIVYENADCAGYSIWSGKPTPDIVVREDQSGIGLVLGPGRYTIMPGLKPNQKTAGIEICFKEQGSTIIPPDCEKKLTGSQTVGTGPLDPAKTESTTLILDKNAVIVYENADCAGYSIWSGKPTPDMVVREGQSGIGLALGPGRYTIMPGLKPNQKTARIEICFKEE